MLQFRKLLLVSLVVGVFMALAGCGGSVIDDIMKNPDNWKDKEITLSGRVDRTMGDVYKKPVFFLKDGRSIIMVLAKGNEMPSPKKKITVTGTIKVDYTVSGKKVDVIIVEK